MNNTIAPEKLQRLINKNAKKDIDRLKEMTRLSKLKIKVIKKDAVEFYKTSVVTEKEPKQKTNSQVASNVSGWVNEFQNRCREDSVKAFNQLFTLQN
jgi:hypothetical protein